MLLRRVLCLQSREDSGFFSWFFFRLPGIVRDSPNSFAAQLPVCTCGRTRLQIFLLTINALSSEGRSNFESLACSFIPPQNWVTRWGKAKRKAAACRLFWGKMFCTECCWALLSQLSSGKNRTLVGRFTITQHVCWINKVTAFSFEFLCKFASREISTTEGSSSLCAFPLGKGETLSINC